MKVVYCKISSWKGRVLGAEHYYVDLERRKTTIHMNEIRKKSITF
jgi:hypothetical protein